jgi:F0F1-type ATP synthase assembly protein I
MDEQSKESNKEKRRKFAGLFIPAGLFIGMGIGWAIGNFLPGMFIGLGVGFLGFAIAMFAVRN